MQFHLPPSRTQKPELQFRRLIQLKNLKIAQFDLGIKISINQETKNWFSISIPLSFQTLFLSISTGLFFSMESSLRSSKSFETDLIQKHSFWSLDQKFDSPENHKMKSILIYLRIQSHFSL